MGLADLVSISATRAASVSTAFVLLCGDAVDGAVSPGHPTAQAIAITSAAVTAPVTAAASVAEIAAAEGREKGQGKNRLGGALEPGLVPWVSPDTPDASRSMVGGGRLARPESAGDEASLDFSSSITTVPLGSSRNPHESACS
jgi:hypothetical protein